MLASSSKSLAAAQAAKKINAEAFQVQHVLAAAQAAKKSEAMAMQDLN